MQTIRARYVALLALAILLLVGLGTLSGCTAAEETTTTGTPGTTAGGTGGTGLPTTPTTGAETTGTAPSGTGTTPPGGSQESVAPVSENFQVCTSCHGNFNAFLADSKVLTKNFSHAIHLNRGYKCEACHPVPTHQPDKIVVPPMQNCFVCHSQEANAIAPGACSACHPPEFPLVPGNHNQPNWLPAANPGPVKTVQAKHPDMAKEDPKYCEMCHAQKFCNDCHRVQMPHPADWQAAHPQTVRSGGDQSCEQCHPKQFLCNDCHHPGYKPTTQPWRQQHPPLVKGSGADGCFKCHNPLTCAHCHITGEFRDLQPTAPAGGQTTTTTGGGQPATTTTTGG